MNETYPGIVNKQYLKELWTKHLEIKQREVENFNDFKEKYVLEVDKKVVGFITFGPARLEEYQGYGEVYAFYILQEYQGEGHGRQMLVKAFSILHNQGYKKIIIGCLEKNKSTKFYEHLGGKLLNQVKRTIKEEQLIENIYLFK